MGFFKGRVSFLRFKVSGSAPRSFEEEHLDRLTGRAMGGKNANPMQIDNVDVGWGAGKHIRDPEFLSEKNIADDALLFDFLSKREKLPTDLMHSYYETDLKALTKNNPFGKPSGRQKHEAKKAARERLEEEAKDGRHDQRKSIPVMWDRLTNEVLFGGRLTESGWMSQLFKETFQRELECVTAGSHAFDLAKARGQTRMVDDSAPSTFIPGAPADIAWIADESSRDFLGNEFLLWLMYFTCEESDTLKLSDDSEVTVMFARHLKLDCPRGQTGQASLTHEGPAKMKETVAGIRVGKLPREAGLTMVRKDQQYEFSIEAETLVIASAKLPAMPEEVTIAQARLEARVGQIRHLVETIDLLYDAFGRKRFGQEWESELKAMQKWLRGEK